MKEKLERLISKRGLGSRREAQSLILNGLVFVNGIKATHPLQLVNPDSDISITGSHPIQSSQNQMKDFVYLIYHKPKGEVTTKRDELGRKTVYDAFLRYRGNQHTNGINPVGRLDLDSTGLLLFTNDSVFANFLTNPENEIPKKYFLRLREPLSDKDIEIISNGILIQERGSEYLAKPLSFQMITSHSATICLTEGKNREVRKIFLALGNKVLDLKRIGFGNLNLEMKQDSLSKAYFLFDHPFPLSDFRIINKTDVWKGFIKTKQKN
ncbi:MAG: pseudouridine synthase [Chloroherpetonaceae bacterium]|nr:pseudouridine synthase [Chloroherpetonaceae bacterium]